MNLLSFEFVAVENSVRPSEGLAEGGCGGNSAKPERIELPSRHLPEYLEGRTPKKNVLSFLEEKIGCAQIRKARNIFLWCPPYSAGGGAGSFVQFPLEKSSSKVYNYSTRMEIKGFEEAEMWDARSASH